MVVFTCNNCGDSVNKPKVEKHIQYECKRKHFAVSFCCVDCLKDFNIDTVKDHCQCVTEEQRYSAKGFVPKASSEKGKRKQAGWVDIVQSVINRVDLPNDERQFLNIISKFDNVPRKKNKFQNFCFSTAPAYRKKGYLVDKVFDMIEAEYKAQQIQNSTEKLADSSNIQNKSNTDSTEKNNTVQTESSEKKNKNSIDDEIENAHNKSDKTTKKEKKKSKQSFVQVNNEVEPKPDDIENTNNKPVETTKKEKKKGKRSLVEVNSEVEPKSDDIENTNNKPEDTTRKEKKKVKRSLNEIDNEIKTKLEENVTQKKKKSHNSMTEENLDINDKNIVEICDQPLSKNTNKPDVEINEENDILNGKGELQIGKKEKKSIKKKMKYQQELAIVSSGVIEVDKEPVSKSKKRKLNGNEENEEPQQKTLKIEETIKIPEVQSGRKFNWNEAITQVLQSKNSKKISISKVMKRVMNEYNFLNETTKKSESKLEKIFLKKLRKMKNVAIDNDKVQLVGC